LLGTSATDAHLRELDRCALRELISRDVEARRFVNSIVHPAVARLLLARVAYHRWLLGRPVCIDAPLFFESGGAALRLLCAPVVCVVAAEAGEAPEAEVARQVQRALARDAGTSEASLRALIAAQLPSAEKASQSHVLIRNASAGAVALAQLEAHTSQLWRAMLANC
jgi:dephospho-CoA kinase